LLGVNHHAPAAGLRHLPPAGLPTYGEVDDGRAVVDAHAQRVAMDLVALVEEPRRHVVVPRLEVAVAVDRDAGEAHVGLLVSEHRQQALDRAVLVERLNHLTRSSSMPALLNASEAATWPSPKDSTRR
jgi:hypothetical protein